MNSMFEMLQNGGAVVSILMTLSVIVLTLILLKSFQFLWLKLVHPSESDKALKHWLNGQNDDAIQCVKGSNNPVDKVLLTAFSMIRNSYKDTNLLKEELSRLAINELNQLRSYLKAIDLIANLSPLLGLLGTVLGMIESFQQMEIAGNKVDPSILSGGIWVALLTTAMGMAIAIPSVAMHSFFERQVDSIKHQMENAMTLVFTKEIVVAQIDVSQPNELFQLSHAV